MDTPATDSQVVILKGLCGVQQIALDASNLSFSTIDVIAHIPELKSLVLSRFSLSAQQIKALQLIGPEIVLIENDS